MNICAAGDVHGRIDKLYGCIKKFESELNTNFDVILQVGDFGIWINEFYHDGITKFHKGTGDFPAWYKEKKTAPVKTYFVNGNNEDFNFLNSIKLSGDLQIIKNLFYIPNGTVTDIKVNVKNRTKDAGNKSGEDAVDADNSGDIQSLIVAGIGGKYDAEHFRYNESDRYYTKREIDNLLKYAEENKGNEDKNIDIFISHDAPEGVQIEDSDKNRYYPKAVGLRDLILKIKPKMVFFGHHHGICKSDIEGIPVYGLNVLGGKGALLSTVMRSGIEDEKVKKYKEKYKGGKYFEKPLIK
ncbi:MAG: metallophosphoesterase [Deltaproteobacteria bacterium]|nr:metallophosphoesterase [Deltaproteobacteria bacterium]